MTYQPIHIHDHTHLPGSQDQLPWLGEYPYVSKQQGIHMIGTLANRPDPSSGAVTGSDGTAVGLVFTATSGAFTANNTGDTIQIRDTGVVPAVVYTFTVTYSTSTQLTLSGSWAGSGSTTLQWALYGAVPSNVGLHYYATDGADTASGALYESDGQQWIPIGSGGCGPWYYVGAADQAGSDIYGHTIASLIATNPDSTIVPFQNSWTNALGSDAPVSFMKDGCMVALRGGAVGGSAGTVIFTLPLGFRPYYQQELVVPTGDPTVWASCIVSADGDVTYEASQT